MKSTIVSLVVSFWIISIAYPARADYYKVTVKRVDQDLYKVSNSRIYIKTKYCYEYANGEEAILKYDKYSYDNALIFESGTSCDVDKIM